MIFAFADCELDTDRLELRRGGEREPVEPQVFDVLVHLVTHRDRLVSREELLARVWGHAYVSDATVSSRLMAARKAIGDDGTAQALIRTVRGRGYRFVGDVVEASPGLAVAAAPRPHGEPPIGREREQSELERLLDGALAGRRQLAIVTGEAGIGKTALVDGLAAEASLRDLLVASGRCVEAHGPREPYMPLLEALGRLARGGADAGVLAALSARGPAWLLQMPWLVDASALEEARLRSLGAGPERMLREMTETLETLAAQRPLLLVLDDLQWADEATLSLVAYVARRPEPSRLMVLATARPAPGHRSEELLRELVPRGFCAEVALSGLPRGAVQEYLSRRHPGLEDDRAVADALHRRTAGNPLFVECLMRSWRERGAIVAEDGRWRRHAPPGELAARVPDTVRGLIEQEVGRLPAGAQLVLEAASVVGARFSAAAAAAAAGLEVEEVEGLCADLARRRLLRELPPEEWPDGTVATTFAFAHDLHREVLYDRLSAARAARLHREVALRLEAACAGAPAERAAELAGHFLRGRQAAPAIRYLRLSAQRAIARGAPAEAVRDARAALELLGRAPDLPDREATELWLHAALAGAHIGVAGYGSQDAERAIHRALEIARARNDARSAAELLHGLSALHEMRGDHRGSEALAVEALHAGAGSAELAAEAHELMACSLFHQGRYGDALEQAERSLSLQRSDHSHLALAPHGEHPVVSCHVWAALALWCTGRNEQALARARAALAAAAEPGRLYSRAYARGHVARLHQMRGEPSPARDHAEAGLALAQEHGLAFHGASARIVLGWARAVDGDEGGVELLDEGLAALRETGAQIDRPYFLALSADAWRAVGRPERGLSAVSEAIETLGRTGSFFWEPELHRVHGLLTRELGGEGSVADAEASLRRALEGASRQGARPLELRAAASLARLLRERGAEAEAGATLEAVCAPSGEEPSLQELRDARALLSELRASAR